MQEEGEGERKRRVNGAREKGRVRIGKKAREGKEGEREKKKGRREKGAKEKERSWRAWCT